MMMKIKTRKAAGREFQAAGPCTDNETK